MLEQKHGKVSKSKILLINQFLKLNQKFFFVYFKNYKMFDLESCISTITLEKLCELCKHIDSWLGSGREKVVVLQDR